MSFFELVEAFDVEDWLGEHTTLRKSGATNHVAHPCPLCGDRKNKFYVNTSGNEHNGRWNSYCCHEQGGLVDLVAKVEVISKDESFSFIRARVEGEEFDLVPIVNPNAPPASVSPSEPPGIEFPSPLYNVRPELPCVVQGKPQTILERGVSSYIIEKHGLLGTADMTYYQGERRFDLDHRLLIPVKWAGNSAVAGWQARDLTGTARHKYVFPAGDRSAETLYDFAGFIQSGASILLIVEGVFQKWAWDKFFAANHHNVYAVASFGKNITKEQEALIVGCSQIHAVILAWDLDATPEVIKTAQKLSGKKELYVMPAHSGGLDYDEMHDMALRHALLSTDRFNMAAMTALNARLALQGV